MIERSYPIPFPFFSLLYHPSFNIPLILKSKYMTYQIVELIANISLASSFLIAVIFGIIEVSLAKRGRREKLTLEIVRSFQTREFAELSGQLTYQKSPTNLQEFTALP